VSNAFHNLYRRLTRELAPIQAEADELSRELGIPSVDLALSVTLHRLKIRGV